MDSAEEVARFLEAITHDPLADAVRGTVRIASISEPGRRGRYQEATVELVASAPGIPDRTVRVDAVFDRRRWPAVGRVLPARVSRAHPDAVDVDWDALAR